MVTTQSLAGCLRGVRRLELRKQRLRRKLMADLFDEKGMTWEEEDWVDEDAVSHRGMDD